MLDRKKGHSRIFLRAVLNVIKSCVTLWNLLEYINLVTHSINKYTYIFTTVEATYK